MEYLDIVDENTGEPAGKTEERARIHEKGIWHRTAHVWLLRKREGKTQILLQMRAKDKDSYPSCFDISSAGHMPAGSGFKDSAVRELKEELGLEAAPEHLVCCGDRRISADDVFHGKEYHDRQYSRVFLLWTDVEEEDLDIQKEEVEYVLWMDFEECLRKVRENLIPHCIFEEELEMVKKQMDMDIRLIALDLDGTTLNSRSELTMKTKEVLEKAIAQGVHVVVATGRTFSAVPDEVKAIKGMEYICTSNGAEIRNLQENTLVYSNYLKGETIEAVVSILRKEDFMLEVFVDGLAYTDAVNYRKAVEGVLGYRNEKYIVDTRNPVEDIFAFMLEHKDRIENVNVNFKDMNDKWRMQPVLEAIPDTTITSSFDHNWEIGGATTSKAEALRNLCRMLGLTADEIMAAGDSPNDGAMLSLAGLPVAVGNAKQVIKDQARFITGTNDEDGVADAIERFVLQK